MSLADRVARRFKGKEIGDQESPLEADLEHDVERHHPDVGKRAQVNDNANEALCKHRQDRATITGVIVKHGQVAGYEIDIKGKRFYAPKKDIFVGKQMVEDVHLDSAKAQEVKQALSHFSHQHDYHGPSWDGIELLHFDLAKATDTIGIEAAGWYKYPSSLRSDMDGKDWRLIVPDRQGPVVVNCHSLLHNSVWSLATTIYSTHNVAFNYNDMRVIYGNKDHWVRTLVWTMEVAKALAIQGYDYRNVIEEYHRRAHSIPMLRAMAAQLIPLVAQAAMQVVQKKLPEGGLSIGPSNIRLEPFAIGMHEPRTDTANYSIICINPKALENQQYLHEVIKHELIHYALGSLCNADAHGSDFHDMAELLDLPKKYRD